MFYKFGIDPSLFLDVSMRKLLSDDFRGALAENSVMQALSVSGLSTYYWMPNERSIKAKSTSSFKTVLRASCPLKLSRVAT